MPAIAREKLWTRDFVFGTAVNFLIMVNYYGLMVVVADYAMKTYDAPAATAGLAASIFVIGALIARLFSGRIMDRVGRKRLLIIGAVLEVAFSALYLTGLGLWLLFALRLLHGIAFGTCSTAIGTIVTALVPDNRKGEGVGYYMLSVTLGAAIGPFLGMFLTQNAGFQTLFLVAAAVALACLLAATQLRVPKNPVSAETVARKASDIARDERIEQAGGFRVPRPSLTNYLESSVIPIGAVCALLFFCYSSLLAFLTPFAAENGLETPASFFFVVYAIATFVTRPFTGKLFDRKGDRVVMVPAFIAFIVGMGLLATVYQPTAMLIAAALLGFGVGTVQASGLALAVRLAPDDRLSLANSTFYILLDIGVGVGPLLLGIVQPLWGYRGLFEAMSLVAIVALAAYLLVSRKKGAMSDRPPRSPLQALPNPFKPRRLRRTRRSLRLHLESGEDYPSAGWNVSLSGAKDCMASMVRANSSSSSQPSISAPERMTSRLTPAAKRLSLNFFFSDFTSKSMTLFEGRITTAAPMRPVSSSEANRIFSICSSGFGSSGLKSEVWLWMARMSSGEPPAASMSGAA